MEERWNLEYSGQEKKQFLIIIAILIVGVVVTYYYFYGFGDKTAKVIEALSPIEPNDAAIEVIEEAECKSLEKFDEYWLIEDCKDNVYFKALLAEDGYSFLYCSAAATPRAKLLDVKSYMGIECNDLTAEDTLISETERTKTYDICGLRIIFIDDCIVWGG